MLVRRMSVQQARANFSDLIGQVYYTKEPVIVEKRGKVFAVVVSPEQYANSEQGKGVAEMKEIMTKIPSQPRRLSEDQVKQGLQALEQARDFREKLNAQRGGKLFSDSAELIRQEREERAARL